MVHFEALLNDHLGAIQDNIYLIDHFIPAIKSGRIYWSILKPLDNEKFKLKDLFSLQLINELNDYFYQIKRLSDDIKGLMEAYKELKTARINNLINLDTYLFNAEVISQNLIELKAFLESTYEETLKLQAILRLTLKRDRTHTMKIISNLVGFFISVSNKPFSEREIRFEKETLEKEVEESRIKSRNEIELIKKKTK